MSKGFIMLTSKQFTARCATIGRAEDALRELVADCLAFAMFHSVKHGNKKPLTTLQASAPLGWLRDQLSKQHAGRRDADFTEDMATARANAVVALMFASRKESLAISRANREARKAAAEAQAEAAPVPEVIAPAVVTLQSTATPYCLTFKGQTLELDETEAEMALQYILAARLAATPVRLAA